MNQIQLSVINSPGYLQLEIVAKSYLLVVCGLFQLDLSNGFNFEVLCSGVCWFVKQMMVWVFRKDHNFKVVLLVFELLSQKEQCVNSNCYWLKKFNLLTRAGEIAQRRVFLSSWVKFKDLRFGF
jgi:hypothetical protein